ncbi:MAG: hypothetical protein OEM82_12380, partial [Acidobacteriota bacterium]|nr:hypothetical protein [Acidobacteriota bacterium]
MPTKKQSVNRYRSAPPSVDAALDKETLIVYGVMPVLEALRSGSGRIRKIAVSDNRRDRRTLEIFDLAKKSGVPVNRIARRELDEILPDSVNHQGVVAFVRTAEYCDASDLIKKAADDPLAMFVLLDGIEDPR